MHPIFAGLLLLLAACSHQERYRYQTDQRDEAQIEAEAAPHEVSPAEQEAQSKKLPHKPTTEAETAQHEVSLAEQEAQLKKPPQKPTTDEIIQLLSNAKVSPKKCHALFDPSASLSKGATYRDVAAHYSRSYTPESSCTRKDDGNSFSCSLSFSEGWNKGEDRGWSSSILFWFEIDETRTIDESTIKCDAAG